MLKNFNCEHFLSNKNSFVIPKEYIVAVNFNFHLCVFCKKCTFKCQKNYPNCFLYPFPFCEINICIVNATKPPETLEFKKIEKKDEETLTPGPGML